MSHLQVDDNSGLIEPRFYYTWFPFQALRRVSRGLLLKGHRVTTVRFQMEQPVLPADLGENHTELVIYLNNSDGALPVAERVYVADGQIKLA